MTDQLFYALLFVLLVVWATISLMHELWKRHHLRELGKQLEEELATRRKEEETQDTTR